MKRVLCFSVAAFFFGLSTMDAQVYVNVNANGADNGTSWANAFTDFQAGVNAATSGEQVWVAKGTYQLAAGSSYSMKSGVAIYGGFAGTETALSQRNWKTNTTILRALNTSVIINKNLVGNAVLDGFTITNGFAHGGGGMFNENSSPLIQNVVFLKNEAFGTSGADGSFPGGSGGDGAPGLGGAIYNDDTSSPVISDTSFLQNQARGGMGGNGANGAPGTAGIGGPGGWGSTGGNGGAGGPGLGGAIFNDGSSPVLVRISIEGNLVYGGIGGNGGFGGNGGNGTDGGNAGSGGNGGFGGFGYGVGIYNNSGANPTIVSSLFDNNTAFSGSGGNAGIGGAGGNGTKPNGVGGNGGNSGNSGNGGDASGVIFNNSSSPTLINVTITKNQPIVGEPGSAGVGGIGGDGGTVGTDGTLGANGQAGTTNGGGLTNVSSSSPLLYNSIIIGNSMADFAGDPIAGGSSNNLLSNADPNNIFADYDNNDFTLKPNPLVVNAGNDADYGSAFYGNTDLAGNPRFVGTIDLGAYEYQANLAVSEADNLSSMIYPNPTRGIVNIHAKERTKAAVYNMNGQLIKSQILNSGNNHIDLSGFANGLYLIKIGNKTFKIIKN